MSLVSKFEKIAEEVRKLTSPATDEEKLALYGLYKQANFGDISTDPPNPSESIVGRAKWEAWNSRKGMSQDEAMAEYVVYAQKMIDKYKV
ncbi:unnamed protein product [Calicophoron daubneyi]|uniref:ACB domain-containing protein n=1 Tax=Calicophoron daubneyi TaxID=300641 RepID=A0AAV2TUA3_CALDB